MRLTSFLSDDGLRLGVVTDRGLLDVASAAALHGVHELEVDPTQFYARSSDLVSTLSELVASADGPYVAEPEFTVPVPTPGKILCVGLNYRRHARETGKEEPKEPVLFAKFSNTLSPDGRPVDVGGLSKVDYEAELAVVIGRTTRRVSPDEALSSVVGYAVVNDVSERDLQRRSGQWLLGKTVDGFLPMGTDLVTADEIPDPQALRIRGWLNGELRQDSNTSDMIFPVRDILAYVSRYFTLSPGDVILTGTPEGVLVGMEEPTWIRPGDRYVVEIEGIGSVETPFV